MKGPQSDKANLVLRFLRYFCPPHLLEEIEGDLLQRYDRDVKEFGVRKAKRRLLWNTIRFFRPGILTRYQQFQFNSTLGLHYNYSKTTLRLLKKRPVYTFLNLVSLTLGIMVFMWVVLYSYSEWSYDLHYKNADDIYRVTMKWKSDSDVSETHLGWSLSALPEQLRESFTGIEAATGFILLQDRLKVRVNNKSFFETGYCQADAYYFTVFEHKWLEGNTKNINENSIVLTNQVAQKYFGDEPAIGHTIEVDKKVYLVAGVIEDIPTNTSFRFNALLFTFNSYTSDWGFTFFKTTNHAWLKPIQQNIEELFRTEYSETLKQSNVAGSYFIEPLAEIHMGEYKTMDPPKVNANMLLILITLTIIILLVSLINYSNLTTSLAAARQRESSIRITMGAVPNNVLLQSVVEATWLTFSAVFISTALIYFGGLYNAFDFTSYRFKGQHGFTLLCCSILGVFALGVFSGFWSYKRRMSVSLAHVSGYYQNRWYLGAVSIFQFCTSLALVFSSGVILKQVKQVSNIGQSDVSQTIVLDLPQEDSLLPTLDRFALELQQQLFVKHTSFTGFGCLPSTAPMVDIFRIDQRSSGAIQSLNYAQVDANYFNLLNLNFIAGRPFMEEEMGSWDVVIVSESYVKMQGWTDSPLDHKVCYGLECDGVSIVGVVQDNSFWGLQKSERPMLYYPLNRMPEKLLIRLSSFDNEKLNKIKALWFATVKEPYEHQFLNQYVAKHLEQERKLERQIDWLSVVSVLLIATSLFGMIQLNLTKYKKAIALRRVFGAEILDLIRLSWRNQLLFFLLAAVLSYFLVEALMGYWLEHFTTKTRIDIAAYGKSIVPLLAILGFAIGLHSWQLKKMKPLDSIRYE